MQSCDPVQTPSVTWHAWHLTAVYADGMHYGDDVVEWNWETEQAVATSHRPTIV